jgi:uncharacterized protein (DUF302 family)
MEYSISKKVNKKFDETVNIVPAEINKEGFSIITENRF